MPRLPPLLLATLLATSLAACKPRAEKDAPEDLSQTTQTPNGLVTVHYPGSFSAKKTGEGSVILSRSTFGKGGAAIGFTSIAKPAATSLDEFVKVVEPAAVKTHDQYVETSRKPATCAGQPGLEIIGSYRSPSGKAEARRACHFMHGGHGYTFNIIAAKELMAEEEALYLRIRNAATLDK